MRAWWALLLLIPTATAGDFTWYAPDEATAGHPIQAAYAIVDSVDPVALQGHVNVDFQVFQDGVLRLESSSIHEHDGMHTFYYTPLAPGPLEFRATTSQGTFSHFVEALPAQGGDVGRRSLENAGWHAEPGDPQTIFAQTEHSHRYEDLMVLWDALDHNRLQVSTVSHIHQVLFFDLAQESGIDRIEGLFTGRPNRDDGRAPGLSVSALPLTTSEPETTAVPWPQPERLTTCTGLITDPAPQVGETWAWSPNSDIRLTVWETEPRLQRGNGAGHRYTLEQYVDWGEALTPDWETLWQAPSHGLFSPITFSPPGPGEYRLTVTPIANQPGQECTVALTILPDPDASGGSATISTHKLNETVTISLDARDGSGASLPHYEFDVRIWRQAGNVSHGALVYAGKLHTHAGPAGLIMPDMEPGTYHVVAHASAQEQNHPRVVSPAPAVFIIEAMDTSDGPKELSPAPMAFVAVAVAFWLRRHA